MCKVDFESHCTVTSSSALVKDFRYILLHNLNFILNETRKSSDILEIPRVCQLGSVVDLGFRPQVDYQKPELIS